MGSTIFLLTTHTGGNRNNLHLHTFLNNIKRVHEFSQLVHQRVYSIIYNHWLDNGVTYFSRVIHYHDLHRKRIFLLVKLHPSKKKNCFFLVDFVVRTDISAWSISHKKIAFEKWRTPRQRNFHCFFSLWNCG